MMAQEEKKGMGNIEKEAIRDSIGGGSREQEQEQDQQQIDRFPLFTFHGTKFVGILYSMARFFEPFAIEFCR